MRLALPAWALPRPPARPAAPGPAARAARARPRATSLGALLAGWVVMAAAPGCGVGAVAPASPLPATERRLVRERWDGTPAVLLPGEPLEVELRAGSVLWVHPEGLPSGAAAAALQRLVVAEIEGGEQQPAAAPQSPEAQLGWGRAYVPVPPPPLGPAVVTAGALVVAGPPAGSRRYALTLLGPLPPEWAGERQGAGSGPGPGLAVRLLYRRLQPLAHRGEGLAAAVLRAWAGQEDPALPLLEPPPASGWLPRRALHEELVLAVPPPPPQLLPAPPPALVRVHRAAMLAHAFAAAASELAELPGRYVLADTLEPEEPAPRLAVEDESGRAYLEVRPGAPLSFRARGPALLQIDSRLPFPRPSPLELRRYDLVLERRPAGRSTAHTWRRAARLPGFATAGQARDERGRQLGGLFTEHLRLEPGEHVYRLHAAQPVLVRLVLLRARPALAHLFGPCRDPQHWLAHAHAALAAARSEPWARAPAAARHLAYLEAALALLAGADDAAERALAPLLHPAHQRDLESDLAVRAALLGARLRASAGDARAAQALLERAEQAAARTGSPLLAKHVSLARARLWRLQGRFDLAGPALLALAREHPDDAGLWAEAAASIAMLGAEQLEAPLELVAIERALALEPMRRSWRDLRERIRARLLYHHRLEPLGRPAGPAAEVYLPLPAVLDPALGTEHAAVLAAGGRALPLLCAQPASAYLEVLPGPAAAASPAGPGPDVEPLELMLGGRPVCSLWRVGGEPLALRLPLEAGQHRLELAGRPPAAALVRGAFAIGDPAVPRLWRLVLERVPAAGGGKPWLRYAVEAGPAPAELRCVVLVRAPALDPQAEPAPARLRLLLRASGAVTETAVVLERIAPHAASGGAAELLAPAMPAGLAPPAGALFRCSLALPPGDGTLEIAHDGPPSLEVGLQLELLRRRQAMPPPPPQGQGPAPRDAVRSPSLQRAADRAPGPSPVSAVAPEAAAARWLERAGALARRWPADPPPPGELLYTLALTSQALRDDPPAALGAALQLCRGWALLWLDEPRLAAAAMRAADRGAPPGSALARAVAAGLIEALLAADRLPQAREALLQQLQLEPGQPAARLRLAQLLLATGEPEAAASLFAEVLEGLPADPSARLGYAEALAAQGRLERAAAELRALLTTERLPAEAHGPARLLAARIALVREDSAAAVALLEDAGAFSSVPELERERRALLQHARRAARLQQRAADPAAPPLERAQALLALARLDAAWPLRAGFRRFALPAAGEGLAARTDRLLAVQTGATSRYHDLAEPGVLALLEGPTLLRLEVRVDVPAGSATPPAEATLELELLPAAHKAPLAWSGTGGAPAAGGGGMTPPALAPSLPWPAAGTARRLRVEGGPPSRDVIYLTRQDLLPGPRRVLYLLVPPGRQLLRLRAQGAAAHARLGVLQPELRDALPGAACLRGPRAAAERAARALALLAPLRGGGDGGRSEPAAEAVRFARLQALLLLGQASAADRQALASLLAVAGGPGAGLAPGERALLLLWLGDARGAWQLLREQSQRAAALGVPDELLLLHAAEQAGEAAAPPDTVAAASAAAAVHGTEPPELALARARALLALVRNDPPAAARAHLATRALLALRRLPPATRADAEARALTEAALAATRWLALEALQAEAGLLRVHVREHPLSDSARLLAALLPDDPALGPGALVSGGRAAAFELELAQPTALVLAVRAFDLEAEAQLTAPGARTALRAAPLELAVAAGTEAPARVLAPPGAQVRLELGTLPAGRHRVTCALLNPAPGRAARVALLAERPLGARSGASAPEAVPLDALAGGRWYPVVPERRLSFAVATLQAPAALRVRGPALLRFDLRLGPEGVTGTAGAAFAEAELPVALELDPAVAPALGAASVTAVPRLAAPHARLSSGEPVSVPTSVELPLPEDRVYAVRLRPLAPGVRLLVRAYVRLDRLEQAAAEPLLDDREAGLQAPEGDFPWAAGRPPWPLPGAVPARPELRDGFGPLEPPLPRLTLPDEPPAHDDSGTLQLLGLAQLHEQAARQVEDRAQLSYLEFAALYRKRLASAPVWLRGGVAILGPERGREVYRAEGTVRWSLPPQGLSWRLDAELAAQQTPPEFAYALGFRSQLRQRLELWSDRLAVAGSLWFRLREQSLDGFGAFRPEQFYFDVFSPYYEDHDRWLEGELELTFAPLLDLEAFATGGARTNRSLRPGDLDRVRAGGGVRGIVGPVFWNLEVEHLVRLRDDDRRRRDEELRLEWALDTVLFAAPSHGVGVGLRGSYVPETGELAIGLELSWLLSGRRVFDDFLPGEKRFADQRAYFYPYD